MGTQHGKAATKVALTSESAVSQASKPAACAGVARAADLEIGDTGSQNNTRDEPLRGWGLETCATGGRSFREDPRNLRKFLRLRYHGHE